MPASCFAVVRRERGAHALKPDRLLYIVRRSYHRITLRPRHRHAYCECRQPCAILGVRQM